MERVRDVKPRSAWTALPTLTFPLQMMLVEDALADGQPLPRRGPAAGLERPDRRSDREPHELGSIHPAVLDELVEELVTTIGALVEVLET
jgi:hypothetical protein